MFALYLVAFLVVACASAGGVLALSWHLRREDAPAPKREARVVVESVPRRDDLTRGD